MFWAHRDGATRKYLSERGPNWRRQGKFFEDWIDRLLVMGVIEERDWDMENGKYFDIPKCCIEWFIELIGVPEAEEIGKSVYTDKHFGKDYFVGYVRCPKCRIEGGFHG